MALVTVPLLLLFPLNSFPMSCQFMTIWNLNHSPLALVCCCESLLHPPISASSFCQVTTCYSEELSGPHASWLLTQRALPVHSLGSTSSVPLKGKIQHIFFPMRKLCSRIAFPKNCLQFILSSLMHLWHIFGWLACTIPTILYWLSEDLPSLR